jgi:hypothetical protein
MYYCYYMLIPNFKIVFIFTANFLVQCLIKKDGLIIITFAYYY